MTLAPFQPTVLKARWVVPIDGQPLENGSVAVAGGRIVSVEPAGARSTDIDLGNVALLPGLVNPHTHLDLTGLRGKLSPSLDFVAWLRGVVLQRGAQLPEDIQRDVHVGCAEILRHGTTLVGDMAANGQSWPVLEQAPLRAVVFYELLGLPQPRAKHAWSNFLDWHVNHPASDTCRPAISPHAPYSVHHSLIHAAAESGLPVTIHLAETLAEQLLLEHHQGPLVAFLTDLGVWEPSGLTQGFDHVLQLTRGAHRILFAHANYISAGVEFPSNATVIYCPRTHAAFGHPTHPFRDLLHAGVRVALGTDSLASNPDLNILAEARFLHEEFPDVPGHEILRMITLSGAEALGWADETGSLVSGKSADLVVLPLPNEDCPGPYRLILESSLSVKAVMFRGDWVL